MKKVAFGLGNILFCGKWASGRPCFLSEQWRTWVFAQCENNTFPGTTRGPRFIRLLGSVGGPCQGCPPGVDQAPGLKGGHWALFGPGTVALSFHT